MPFFISILGMLRAENRDSMENVSIVICPKKKLLVVLLFNFQLSVRLLHSCGWSGGIVSESHDFISLDFDSSPHLVS